MGTRNESLDPRRRNLGLLLGGAVMTDLDEGPVEDRYHAKLQALGRGIDEILNGRPEGGWPRKTPLTEGDSGFVLLMFTLRNTEEGKGRMNYLSNCRRADMLQALERLVARMKTDPEWQPHD